MFGRLAGVVLALFATDRERLHSEGRKTLVARSVRTYAPGMLSTNDEGAGVSPAQPVDDRTGRTSAPGLVYAIRARATAHGTAQVDAGSETILFDSSWASEPSGLRGPAELLAGSFASCLLKNLERAGRLLDFHYGSAAVDVTARRQDDPPRFIEISYEMRVTTDEPERRLDLVHRNLQKYGTVYNTLAAVCDVHGSLRAEAPVQNERRRDH